MGGTRPLTPLVLMSCWEGQTSCVEGGTSCGALPTPEERTRSQARAVVTDIVPINVTGESFDRQAGLQRSLSNRDSLNQRPNLQRRKTITGTPQDFCTEMVRSDQVHFSTVDHPSSVHDLHKTSDQERNQTEPRRIRAPRGDLCSLMTSLTSPKHLEPQEVHWSTSCPQTETSSDCAPYRTLHYSPSDRQSEIQSVSCSSVSSSQLQDEPWSYQPLSPSCSLHSAQEPGSVCGEAWNCDPLLFSGRSSPSQHSLFSDDTSCSSSLHLYNNPSHSFSQTSLYFEEITSDSSHIPDKIAAPSSITSHTTSPSYNSLSSEATSNFSSKLDKNSSYSQSSLCSSSSLKLDKRYSVSSGSSLCRSICLRKSKRPPAPPMRTDSLRHKPIHQKPPRLEKKKTDSSSPQTFDNPWVPRSDAKRRQSRLNCGTVTTFEPLQLEPKEILPTTPNRSQVFVSCENGLQRLASPSSGYSSQSNTPTAGTPLSSPLTPSSPLTGNSEIPAFLNASKCIVSSFPRTKSNGKPKPPERKSSLLSSLSSSFSSTSSLSSYTSSSDSSAKHLPPPLPVSKQLPVCPYHIRNSNVPSSNAAHNPSNSSCTVSTRPLPHPPPLPVFNQQLPVCHSPNNKPLSKSPFSNSDSAVWSSTNSIFSTPLPPPPLPPPLPPHLPLPTPPPLPATPQDHSQQSPPPNLNTFTLSPTIALTTASPPSPPPLPPLLSRLSPPPYSHALKQSNFPHSSLVPSSKPPLPPLPALTASPTCTLSKSSSCTSPKMAKPTFPLVTTQALRNVKLRSVKSQEIICTNSMPSMETPQANTSLEKLRNKPHANSFSSLSESSGCQVKLNPIKCEISKPRDGVSCPNLSQQQSFAQKFQEESTRQVSSPTNTEANTNHAGFKITEDAHTDLITSHPNYNLPQSEKNKPKNYLACAEKSQHDFGDKGSPDSINPVSRPPSKTGVMSPEEVNTPLIATKANYKHTELEINKLGADLRLNERFEEAFEDTNKTKTVLTSVCSLENHAIHISNQVNYNQTKCENNNPGDTLSRAKPSQQPSLDKNKKVHEDLDLCGESCQSNKETDTDNVRYNSVEVCSIKVRDESNQDKYNLQKSPKMVKPTNHLPCNHLWSQQGSNQEDLETYAPTGNARISTQTRKESKTDKTAFMNENDKVEIDKRLTAADVRSKDFNIQNALITNVNQYELKTSQTYFQTCDNIPNPLDFQEDCPLKSFRKRHQAYLDMYAMLAGSTVSGQATEEAKVDSVLEKSNLGTTHVRSKKTKAQSKVNYPHYNMMEQDEFKDGKGPQDQHGSARLRECPEDGRHTERDQEGSNVYAPMKKSRVTSSESPWVKISCKNEENHFTPQDQEVPKAEEILLESQYWSLSERNYKTESEKKDISVMSNVPELDPGPANLKEGTREKCSPRKLQSPDKPVLPKKPDRGILALLMSPERTTSIEKITPDKAQVAPTTPNSPQRQKLPILHKKLNLSTLTSPKSSPSHLPLNDIEQVSSSRTLENCGASQIWTTRNTENDNSSTILSTSTMENCVTTISSNNFIKNCENSSIMPKSTVPTIGTMDNKNLDTSTVFGTSALDYYDTFRMWSSTMKNNAVLGNYSNNTQENCDYSASAKENAATSGIRFRNNKTSAIRSNFCSGMESRIRSTMEDNASKICNIDNHGQIWSPGTGINPERLSVSVPSTMESHGPSLFWDSTAVVGTISSRMCSNSAINNTSNSRARDDVEKSANWTEKLENTFENSSDNIWCPRNIENTSNPMENYSTSSVINHITRGNVGNTTVFGEWITNNRGASTIPANTEENGCATRTYIQQNATLLSQIQSLQTQQSCSYRSGVMSPETRGMWCPLAEDECVTENMGKTTIMMPNKKTRKRRKRRANKPLLMKKMEHSTSSSSSTSSENEFEKSLHLGQRRGLMKVGDGDSNDLDGSCDDIDQSRLSLSRALSTDSLKGEPSLPELLIHEEDEQGRPKALGKAEGNDVFESVSADQVTVPSQIRTTDDLFAIIHRSKRKMFGRKDCENNRSSSSLSPPSTPTDLPPQPKGQSLSRSDSFKALLLKKGGHFTSTHRPSAVERLCGVRPHLQKTETEQLLFGWVSTSCVFVSASCVRRRPLTPLSSVSRRCAARSRFNVTPMASILENDEEEDEDDEVFVWA